MDTSVQKIIDTAKRYAMAVDAAHLGCDEILVALAALSDDEAIAKAVCRVLEVKKIAWPAELRTEAQRAAAVDPQQAKDRKFALEPRFKEAFNSLKKEANVIKLDAFVESVLNSRDCSRVQLLWAQKKKRGGLLGRLDECDAKRVRLEAKLAEKVIGQEEAIRSLGESYAQLLREPDRPGLRGIFTFVGPPGVGKTFLAEEFASALNEGMGESEKYEAHLFSMNTSDPAGTILQLFGSPSTYTNGKHGQLYELIQKNPRQILIFDEIEKAHESFIPSLLTLLSAGAFVDQHENERVDASRCYVIFTTNLGQEFFSSPKAAGVMRGGRFSSEQIFDLLAAAKRREVAQYEQASSAFSPEFVDRLRQGSAVLFNRLTIAHYKQLLRKALASQASDTLLPPVEISPAAEPLLILSLMPDLTARRLVSEIMRLKHRWTDEVMRAELPHLEKSGASSFKLLLDVDLDAKSTKELDELFRQRTVKILVVDNDERMTRFVKRYAGWQLNQREVHVKRVDNPGETVDAIAKERPDLLLLDLDLDKDQLPSGGLKVLQKQISEAFPSLPLWIFSESRDEQADELPDWVEEGGVRGYFAFQQDAEGLSIVEEDQQERFSELLQEVVFHRIMLELVRSRSQLALSYDVVDSRHEDAESAAAGVLITRFTRQQHVSVSIDPDQIAPAEVPETTFEDVFGLERAKERLKDAVEMLKNPGRLAKFNETAPSGYLLAGPSGTGKTHLARAVANAAECLFFSVSCGELVSKWVGKSEQRIRQLFKDARQYAPSVIFIDEIDAIAGRRDGMHHEHSTAVLNQLLTCIDGFSEAKGQVLLLAATNRPDALDPAIRRPGRFDEIIPIDLPGEDVREKFLRVELEKKPCAAEVMEAIPEFVAQTAGLSPAELRRILREAVYTASKEGREMLTRDDLEKSVGLVRAGITTSRFAPAEKPATTFADVFGLERAKERLKDAVDLLKNPGRLTKFNEAPPSGYLLAGPSGTGKTHLARATANAADCYFFSLSCGDLEEKHVGETEENIRQLFKDARQYAPSVIFIDEIDAIAGKRDGKVSEYGTKILNQLLTCMDGFGEAKGQVLVLAATNRPDALDPAIRRPGRFDEVIPIDLPGTEAREQMLRALLAKKPCSPEVMEAIPEFVAQTAGLSPAELRRILREAVYTASKEGREMLTRDDLEKSVGLVRAGITTSRFAPAEKPPTTFADVFGLERAKERLKDAVDLLKNPGRLTKFNEAPPSGYLLAGPSGTGKTHLARATANAADCYFFSLSCGEMVSKYFAESEENIRQLFKDARQYAPSVIFIDEIDAIAGRRDGMHHEHSTAVLNQLLTCIDGFSEAKGQVLMLAATNRPDALDPAIKRPGRFDEIIPIDVPGAEAREQMLRALLAKKPCEPEVTEAIPRLVSRTASMSPAEVDRVIREAVYLATRNNCEKISVLHLEDACNLVQYGAEKRDITITEEDRRRTAWHEAGHAVANLILFPETKLDLLTIIPSESGALGFAAYAADETRHGWSADDFRKRIVMCLAGREAEKLCPGAGNDAVNTGVSSDYEQATRWAWNYVSLFGFDEKFGVFSVAGLPESARAALAESIQARAQELLSSCLKECRQLMQENQRSLQALADVLLAKQAIYGDEAKKVFDASRA